MSENFEPGAAQPPPGGGGGWGTPPPAPGPWGPATAPGGSWGAPSYGWGAPPPPARPPRNTRVHVIWLVVALVAALGCGTAGFVIGKSSAQISSAIKSDAAAAGAKPCHGASPAPGVGAHLANELLPLPAGGKYLKGRYRHQVDSLDQFVSTLYSSAPREKDRLIARCFQVAAQQGWVLPSGRIVAVYLVQFGTPADARSYALAAQSADIADPRNKLHDAVKGVSDGILIEDPTPDKYGNTVSRLLGDKGNIAIIVHVFVPAHLPLRASATRLLLRQAARL
ncbi:MAG TPA: hypothetical protein VF162_02590 [Streptosporangiaceae bacterium]